jgi:hypothetical protein
MILMYLNIKYLLYFILSFELSVLVILILFILGRRVWLFFKEKKDEHAKQMIAKILLDGMKYQLPIERRWEIKALASQEILLNALEQFDHRFSDEKWDELKRRISALYLLPRAREGANSWHWINRHFSARCFALTPFSEDERTILALLDDPVFLVRSQAAIATVRLEIKEGVEKIIQYMSKEPGYARYFYRDLLLQGRSKEFFLWIETIALKTQDLGIQLACLDILADKTITLTLSFLHRDLESDNVSLRIAAVKVFARNPQKDSADVLLKSMEDPHPEIRAEAAYGLEYFATKESFEKLTQALRDETWTVRLQAAKSLKRMGRTGMEILKQQNAASHREAYDAAQYALQFD